jgi:hypothetical protein
VYTNDEQEIAMDRFLTEHRKNVLDFEVIDCVDEQAIGSIRQKLEVVAPMHVRWNDWEYGSEIAELRRLYEKGKTAQWNATSDLDWSIPVSKDEFLGNPMVSIMASVCQMMGHDEATQKAAMFDEVAWLFSQLLHGEQGALQICGQLTNLCSTTDEKFYAASQVADEARHTETFARFLTEKMGTIYPVSPVAKTLLDELLSVEGYRMKTLGMQTLFEGFAMGLMDMMREAFTNPLAVDLLRRVELDEARHAAFACSRGSQRRREERDGGLVPARHGNAQRRSELLDAPHPRPEIRHRSRRGGDGHAGAADLGRDEQPGVHAHRRPEPRAPRPQAGPTEVKLD